MSDVRAEVRAYLTTEVLHRSASEPIDEETNLLIDGVLDSLGLQIMVGFLEERFAISIGDADLLPENFETVASIAAMVEVASAASRRMRSCTSSPWPSCAR